MAGVTALDIGADVLVAGGGPAGAWTAIKAAEAGADVVLVDKGYCGTSGATAAAGTAVWYLPPDPDRREPEMERREALGGYLSDRRWMARVLDQAYANTNELGEKGRYPFPSDGRGGEIRRSLQGPEYMRRMRIWVRRAGVRILDHSPLLELLLDNQGTVAGGAGHRRQAGVPYRVRAGAVVLATGGCAFQSGTLGCDVDTGDGALLAAEAGAPMSGMEFSNAYAIAPVFGSVTRTAYYTYGTFYREDGTVLEGIGSRRGRPLIARALLEGPVLCRLDHAGAEVERAMRLGQPNFFLPFDRLGIDPFRQLFPVTLLAEGTVRGTGGIQVTGDDCATTVPGLYAAGDAASREVICGGFSGGGAPNAAWAMSSGTWAGRAAAAYAAALGGSAHRRRVRPAGGAGLRPERGPGDPGGFDGFGHRDVVAAVQAEVLPYDKNYLRHGDRLAPALKILDDVWAQVRDGLAGLAADAVRTRQAAAMTAVARWMYASALARRESRGMHARDDLPGTDPAQRHRLVSGGLDQVWVRPEPVKGEAP